MKRTATVAAVCAVVATSPALASGGGGTGGTIDGPTSSGQVAQQTRAVPFANGIVIPLILLALIAAAAAAN